MKKIKKVRKFKVAKALNKNLDCKVEIECFHCQLAEIWSEWIEPEYKRLVKANKATKRRITNKSNPKKK